MFETIILPISIAILGAISAIFGAFIGAFIGGKYQLRAIEAQHQQELQEIENTNRELVQAYADSLVFQLRNLSEIGWLEKNNENNQKYTELKKYILNDDINAAKPQETRGHQIVFLIFQFMAAFWLSRASRFSGMMTLEYKDFLDKWESKFEPIFCSNKYPGKPWLYREQIEIIAEEMLVVSEKTDITRPMHWKEFVEKIESKDKALLELVNHLKSRITFVFSDADNIENRQRTLSRLAFLGLYLTDIFSKYNRSDYIEEAEVIFWNRITDWSSRDEFWFENYDSERRLYVFEEGDIQKPKK